MNYTLYTKQDAKYDAERVLFENGIDYCVSEDSDGNKWFQVPNIYNTDELFIDRIKDAVQAVIDGHGDVIASGGKFGSRAENVYKYVDRVYGEKQRQKSLEAFKNYEFGYSVKFGYLDSISGGNYVGEDEYLKTLYDDKAYIFFKEKTDAEEFVSKIIQDAKGLLAEYDKIGKMECDKKVSWNVALAMLRNKGIDGTWKLDVVQAIKP